MLMCAIRIQLQSIGIFDFNSIVVLKVEVVMMGQYQIKSNCTVDDVSTDCCDGLALP
jgi:hypothetical protein